MIDVWRQVCGDGNEVWADQRGGKEYRTGERATGEFLVSFVSRLEKGCTDP